MSGWISASIDTAEMVSLLKKVSIDTEKNVILVSIDTGVVHYK